jgi:hypothetical protein
MQQINLYLPEFHPNREPFRAIQMLWALVAVIVVLSILSFFSHRQHAQLLQELTQIQISQQELQTQLQKITQQKPMRVGPELDADIDRLTQELQRHQKITAMMSSQYLGNDKGFSAQLKAFSDAALPAISLDTFSLQLGGSYAELTGKTTRADQVPLYVQRLRADASFAKVGFGVLTIDQDQSQQGVLHFSFSKISEASEEQSVNKAEAIWNQAVKESAEKDALWKKSQ